MNTQRKDFDEVYEECTNGGFLFHYNKRISKSKLITKEDMKNVPTEKGNIDKIFVVCRKCDEFMNFTDGPDILEGYWVCPCCGAKMKEQTAYMQLDRENNEFLNEFETDDFDEIYN